MSKLTTLQFLLSFLVACCAFPLIYICLAAKGDTWVYPALVWSRRASFLLCCAAAALAYILRSRRLFIGVILAALIWHFGPIPGQIECTFSGLSGGYDRFTNCGFDSSVFAGVTALAFVFVSSWRIAAFLAVSLAATVPSGILLARSHFTTELLRALSALDLKTECVIRQSVYDYYTSGLSGSRRVHKPDDLRLNWIIGEDTPRIYKIEDGAAHIWKFSRMTFEHFRAGAHLSEICVSDQDDPEKRPLD